MPEYKGQKVSEITLSASQLDELYLGRGYEINEIAHFEGVSAPTIRYWLNEYGIQLRGAKGNCPGRKPLVEHFENGMTPREVGFEYEVTRSTVYHWCRKLDINHQELRGVENPHDPTEDDDDEDVFRAGPDTEVDAPDRPDGFYTLDEDESASKCPLDKDELYYLYWGQQMTISEMADLHDDATMGAIRHRMNQLGVPRRSSGYKRADSVPPWVGYRSDVDDKDSATDDTDATVEWTAAMD